VQCILEKLNSLWKNTKCAAIRINKLGSSTITLTSKKSGLELTVDFVRPEIMVQFIRSKSLYSAAGSHNGGVWGAGGPRHLWLWKWRF